jgi:hypothetical protein
MVGALVALAASAGLAWWSVSGDVTTPQPDSAPRITAPAAPPPAPKASASPAADAAQVDRAYDAVREVYADGGADGLVQFSSYCAQSLRADPQVLDFCLAFDLYATPVVGSAGDANAQAWFHEAPARGLAAARAALPAGADADGRLDAVRRLARRASAAAPATAKPAARVRAPAAPKAAAARPRAKPAVASRPCRLRSTPVERVLCASPALQKTDRRLQRAYGQALASGADRRRLARDQAHFRVSLNAASPDRAAVAKLYERRIGELRQLARRR